MLFMQPPVPSESTVSVRPMGLRSYHVLHNVLLREKGLLFYVPDHLADVAPDFNHTAPTHQELKNRGNFWDREMDDFKARARGLHWKA